MDILICNLKDDENVLNSSYLISAYSGHNVSMLVYEEDKELASIITGVSIYTINKSLISSLTKSIYPKGHALDLFYEDLKVVTKQWDLVINYSGGSVASFITSYLNFYARAVNGCSIGEFGNTIYSDDWSLILHEFTLKSSFAPFHFIENQFFINDIMETAVTLKESYDNNDFLIDKIRKENNQVKIVILRPSSLPKELDERVIIQLIDKLLDYEQFYPALMILSGKKDEKELADVFRRTFGESLPVLEVNLVNIASCLKHADFLVSLDASTSLIADILNISQLQIVDNNLSLIKSTRGIGNLVLAGEITSLKADDILFAIESFFFKRSNYRIVNASLYQVVVDNSTTFYRYKAGAVNKLLEIKRIMATMYFNSYFSRGESKFLLGELLRFDLKELVEFIEDQREKLEDATRSLLSIIRVLLVTKNNNENNDQVVNMVHSLVQNISNNDLTMMPLIFFKYQTHSMMTIADMEKSLYNLKGSFQLLANIFKTVEDLVQSIKKDDLIKKGHYVIQVIP